MPLPVPVGSLGCVGTQSSHHRASPSPGPWSIAAAAHVQDVDGLGRSNCPHSHTLALCRPVPDLERSQVACLHSPRVWAIPQRAKEKASILAWWLSSTSSFRRSSLPRWNFYAFGERGELMGPTLPFLPPTLEPPSFRVLNHSSTALSTLTFSYGRINRLLLKESVRFRIAIQFLVEKSFHRLLSPHPTAHPPVLTKSGIQSPISPSILIPAQHGAEMSMNAKPWKPRSFSLRVSLTVLPLRWS